MNFQPMPQTVEVDMSGVNTSGLVDVRTNSSTSRNNPLKLELPAYGYRGRLYKLQPAERSVE